MTFLTLSKNDKTIVNFNIAQASVLFAGWIKDKGASLVALGKKLYGTQIRINFAEISQMDLKNKHWFDQILSILLKVLKFKDLSLVHFDEENYPGFWATCKEQAKLGFSSFELSNSYIEDQELNAFFESLQQSTRGIKKLALVDCHIALKDNPDFLAVISNLNCSEWDLKHNFLTERDISYILEAVSHNKHHCVKKLNLEGNEYTWTGVFQQATEAALAVQQSFQKSLKLNCDIEKLYLLDPLNWLMARLDVSGREAFLNILKRNPDFSTENLEKIRIDENNFEEKRVCRIVTNHKDYLLEELKEITAMELMTELKNYSGKPSTVYPSREFLKGIEDVLLRNKVNNQKVYGGSIKDPILLAYQRNPSPTLRRSPTLGAMSLQAGAAGDEEDELFAFELDSEETDLSNQSFVYS